MPEETDQIAQQETSWRRTLLQEKAQRATHEREKEAAAKFAQKTTEQAGQKAVTALAAPTGPLAPVLGYLGGKALGAAAAKGTKQAIEHPWLTLFVIIGAAGGPLGFLLILLFLPLLLPLIALISLIVVVVRTAKM